MLFSYCIGLYEIRKQRSLIHHLKLIQQFWMAWIHELEEFVIVESFGYSIFLKFLSITGFWRNLLPPSLEFKA
jgi:hypothetical protein